MQFGSILVTVTTAGTPVRVTTDEAIRVRSVQFQAVAGDSGKMWIGLAAMVKATYVNVLATLSAVPATAGPLDRYTLEDKFGGNTVRLADIWVDADTNGMKLLVTYAKS